MRQVTGACNRCGACCRTLAMPVPANWTRDDVARRVHTDLDAEGFAWRWLGLPRLRHETEEYLAFLAARGVDSFPNLHAVPLDPVDPVEPAEPAWRLGTYGPTKTPVVYLKARCVQLRDQPDGTAACALHGTPRKPAICERFPQPLDDLGALPECGFTIADDAGDEEHTDQDGLDESRAVA